MSSGARHRGARRRARTAANASCPTSCECQLPSARGPSRLGTPFWLVRATMRPRGACCANSHVDCRGQHRWAPVAAGGPRRPAASACRCSCSSRTPSRAAPTAGCQPFARRIYHGLPSAQSVRGARSLFTGTPLRPEIRACRSSAQAREVDSALPLQSRVVLVTGGSQGARSALNETVPKALLRLAGTLPQRPVHVLHLAGLGRDEEVRRTLRQWRTRRSAAGPGAAGRARHGRVCSGLRTSFSAAVAARRSPNCAAAGRAGGDRAVSASHRDRQQLRNAAGPGGGGRRGHRRGAAVVRRGAAWPRSSRQLLRRSRATGAPWGGLARCAPDRAMRRGRDPRRYGEAEAGWSPAQFWCFSGRWPTRLWGSAHDRSSGNVAGARSAPQGRRWLRRAVASTSSASAVPA
jgi:hypothetical protein